MQKHLKKFNQVDSKSNGSLAVFVQTMERLKNDSEEMVNLHSEVTNDIESLIELRESIVQRVAKNTDAINGISKILEGNF